MFIPIKWILIGERNEEDNYFLESITILSFYFSKVTLIQRTNQISIFQSIGHI